MLGRFSAPCDKPVSRMSTFVVAVTLLTAFKAIKKVFKHFLATFSDNQ